MTTDRDRDAGHVAHALAPTERTALHRAWYVYDWALSAYVTTSVAVLLGPYLTVLAKRAACPQLPSTAHCPTPVNLLGFHVLPGAVAPLSTTVATIAGALLLPIVGAMADRSDRPRVLLATIAWIGAAAATAMGFARGTNWQLLVVCQVVATFCVGASMTVYNSILVAISTPDERDGVSSRGWALGYAGGFLLLLVNLAAVSKPDLLGLSQAGAVRLSLASAGIWWAVFTFVPWWGLRRMPVSPRPPDSADGGVLTGAFVQLGHTLKHLAGYRNTWLFLLAALLFNDGVQTVISNASLYGQEQLGLQTQQLMLTILLVQFVAFFGALLFGRIAGRMGAKKSVLTSLVIWAAVSIVAMGLPRGQFVPFLVLAFFIGLVLGGTQALARALFSQLIPYGREAEYFALYESAERGTSWFGTLMFASVFQATHSYRPSIASLTVFFVLGGLLLSRVRVREGIEQAGNTVPETI